MGAVRHPQRDRTSSSSSTTASSRRWPKSLRHGPRGSPEGASTNIESALQLAYGLFPTGHLKRAVVLTDGAETDGDLLAESQPRA